MTEKSPLAWAVIVNPAKVEDLAGLEQQVADWCRERSRPEPTWYVTTEEDPGTGQARQAISDGATLVCPYGGDGTVRAVATGILDHDGVTLGLLPGGTGNLLARNLGIPHDRLESALEVVLDGTDRPVDVGEARFDDGEFQIFLVMAGMGLDADAMAGASTELKRRVGWVAYLVAGVRAIATAGFAASLQVDGSRPISRRAATVVAANCGEVTAGLELLPGARVDDGLLDVLVASPRTLAGWLTVGVHLATRGRFGSASVDQLTGPAVSVRARRAVNAEVDGDVIGRVHRLEARIRPLALRVRVPRRA